jgi:hypothetical protein
VAVTPLFWSTKAGLVSALRLTGAAGTDQVALIDSGLASARLKFYRHLGTVRVAYLVALGVTENPTSLEGLLRLQAAETETKIVRRHLIETMPQLFMDASGNSLEVFNTEAAFRQGRPSQRALDAMDNEILKDMDVLKGDVSLGEEFSVLRTDTIEPEEGEEAPDPGASIWTGNDQGTVDRDEFPIADQDGFGL